MLPENFRPMLAVNYDKVKQQPAVRYASEKLDGVRCLFFGGVAYSRSLKPLPNKQLQQLAQQYKQELEAADGEVIVGNMHAVDVLQTTTGFCMSADKQADFCVYLFDRYDAKAEWWQRYSSLQSLANLDSKLKVLEHWLVRDDLAATPPMQAPWINLSLFEEEVLSKGGEGVMLRDAYGSYKLGRSATKQPELQKVKRFNDAEFKVVGFKQFETNQNELEHDERGYAKRSSSKAGKQLVEQLGGLVLLLPDGQTFNCGSGFTEEQRLRFWEDRAMLLGKQATVQFFGYSKDGIPLLPVFKQFRSALDM